MLADDAAAWTDMFLVTVVAHSVFQFTLYICLKLKNYKNDMREVYVRY